MPGRKFIISKDINQAQTQNSLKLANKIEVMKLSMAMDTTSPMDAASGVAMLSGFTLYLLDSKITATSTKSKNNFDVSLTIWFKNKFGVVACTTED